jgi:hypothetical protein
MSDDLQEAQALFQEAGLPFPYIPPEMQGDFQKVADWFYCTRTDTANLNELKLFESLTQGKIDDYVLLAQIGHGTNSWEIRYEIAHGALLLILGCPWGGAYMDNNEAAQAMSRQFQTAHELIQTVTHAQQTGKLAADEYISVNISAFLGGGWLRLTVPAAQNPLEMDWQEDDNALQTVIDLLKD